MYFTRGNQPNTVYTDKFLHRFMYISANSSGSDCPVVVSSVFHDCPQHRYHQWLNHH